MAFIGMRHPVASVMSAHTKGQEPTYGTGMIIGHAIQGDLAITRNNNPLYGDDVEVENDNSITAMQLTLGVDDLSEEVQAYVGLLKEVVTGTGNDAVTHYLETAGPSNTIGLGYIRVRRLNDVTTVQAIWIYSLNMGRDSENTATKGEQINWQTPTVTGRAKALFVDSGNEPAFRRIQNFTTESSAITWLNTMAGISSASSTATST